MFPRMLCSGLDVSRYVLSPRLEHPYGSKSNAHRTRCGDSRVEYGRPLDIAALNCQYRKSLFELVTVSVGLHNPEMFIAVLCDADQVIFGTLRKPILTHVSPCGVAARPPISRRRCVR